MDMQPVFLTQQSFRINPRPVQRGVVHQSAVANQIPSIVYVYSSEVKVPAAIISDLAILQGGDVQPDVTIDGQPTGPYWTSTPIHQSNFVVIGSCAERFTDTKNVVMREEARGATSRSIGARPVLLPDVTREIPPDQIRRTRKIGAAQIVEYGEYPQTITSSNVSNALEDALAKGQLKTTGKDYTFDAEPYNAYQKPFRAKKHPEYMYDGKKYIAIEAAERVLLGKATLSNNAEVTTGTKYWVEVEPIEWLMQTEGPEKDSLVALKVLFAGIQFHHQDIHHGADAVSIPAGARSISLGYNSGPASSDAFTKKHNFADTDMAHYLKDNFAKEIQPSRAMEIAPTSLSWEAWIRQGAQRKIPVSTQLNK